MNQSLCCHFFWARSLCFLLCTQQVSVTDLLSERVNNVLGASPCGSAKCQMFLAELGILLLGRGNLKCLNVRIKPEEA